MIDLSRVNKVTYMVTLHRLTAKVIPQPKSSQVFFCFVVRAKKAAEIKPKLEFACQNGI